MRIVWRNEAIADYLDAVDWYEQRQPGLGTALRNAVRKAEARITVFPLACRVVERDFRGCLLQKFPFQLVYRVEADVVRVYALFHCSLDPQQRATQLPDTE